MLVQHEYHSLSFSWLLSNDKLKQDNSNHVNWRYYIRFTSPSWVIWQKNKGTNTSRNNVLDSHWAKSFIFSLISLVFHPAGCLATLLTRQIRWEYRFSCWWPDFDMDTTGLHNTRNTFSDLTKFLRQFEMDWLPTYAETELAIK